MRSLQSIVFQSFSTKQLFSKCDRIEAEQQQTQEAKSQFNSQNIDCESAIQWSRVLTSQPSLLCWRLMILSYICKREKLRLSTEIYINFLLYDKQQHYILPVDVIIKPSIIATNQVNNNDWITLPEKNLIARKINEMTNSLARDPVSTSSNTPLISLISLALKP